MKLTKEQINSLANLVLREQEKIISNRKELLTKRIKCPTNLSDKYSEIKKEFNSLSEDFKTFLKSEYYLFRRESFNEIVVSVLDIKVREELTFFKNKNNLNLTYDQIRDEIVILTIDSKNKEEIEKILLDRFKIDFNIK